MTALQRVLIGGGIVALALGWWLATPVQTEAQFNFPKFNQNMTLVPCNQIIPGIGFQPGISGLAGITGIAGITGNSGFQGNQQAGSSGFGGIGGGNGITGGFGGGIGG